MRTLLVDGDSVLVRASRAVRWRGMPPEDEAAVFLGSLRRYVQEEQPGRLIVAWDSHGHLWRRDIYRDYKGTRHRSGASTRCHDISREILELMRVPQDLFRHCEADDVIAAYCSAIPGRDQAVIVSGDKDLLQLAGKNISVRMIKGTKGDDLWDEARVFQQLGCMPRALPHVVSLAGDPSDNIPGIRGFGRKRALSILGKSDWDIRSILWKDEESYYDARRWLSIVDLYSDDASYHRPMRYEVPEFNPVTGNNPQAFRRVREALLAHGMGRLEKIFTAGQMWAPPG